MKKVFLLFIGVASFATMQAQSTKFGLKAGANFANFAGDVEDSKMKIGLNVGAFAKIGLTEAISLQPELVFSSQGAKFEDPEEGDGKMALNYLNIPVLFQYNFDGFYAETGPQLGFLMSAKAKPDEGEDVDIKDAYKSTDFSWAIGAGYLTKSGFGFNARFNLGLSNLSEVEIDDYKIKNSVIQVGVFYAFGGKK